MALSWIGHPQSLDEIPQFLTARTPMGLRRAMLRNNTRQKGFVVYQDIQWVESDRRWYAWFYVKVEQELMSGDS